ncbi:MAG: AMP-binding protein [Treponema sp.]|jgi:long-chain acyl-CoA synthetase|nr:AMP-binding protein [Treponema sp.]
MLNFEDYVADWPDIPWPNYASWLENIEKNWSKRIAILYRSGKQKEFTRWTYGHFAAESRRIGRGLLAAGLSKGDRVVLWAENRPEWMAIWVGVAAAGLAIVPVDFLVSEQECLNIIKITGAKAFFYSGRKQNFADSLAEESLAVKVCVSKAEEGGAASGAASRSGLEFPGGIDAATNGSSEEWARFGADALNQAMPDPSTISENDPVSIVFTSGTTGFAKGVTLCHKGIIANASAAIRSLRAYEWDVFINVLPLHHTYPTTCSFMAPLSIGAATIIVEKLVGKVVIDDIRDGKGTFLIAVPLLYDKVMAALDQGFRKLSPGLQGIFNKLRKISLDRANQGKIRFGRIALSLIRKKAGLASIRMVVAGGGPLSPATADFFDSFGFNMVHGYGMSENSPLISVNTPWHRRNASVGLPVKYTEVRIDDLDEQGHGEIVIKSPSLMLGYYNDPASTAEVITSDGWLRTGDLGYRDEDGYIYINGRKKNLIVSSGGKNIYPEEIETHFAGSRVIGEILVLGKKESAHGGEQIFAVVVPNAETLAEDYPGKELDDAFLRDLVKKEIEAANRHLASYKKISDFTLRREAFEKNAQQKIRRFLYKDYSNFG